MTIYATSYAQCFSSGAHSAIPLPELPGLSASTVLRRGMILGNCHLPASGKWRRGVLFAKQYLPRHRYHSLWRVIVGSLTMLAQRRTTLGRKCLVWISAPAGDRAGSEISEVRCRGCD